MTLEPQPHRKGQRARLELLERRMRAVRVVAEAVRVSRVGDEPGRFEGGADGQARDVSFYFRSGEAQAGLPYTTCSQTDAIGL